MSINRVRLRNFRCFEDSGEIDLAPLTLIFGRNNTGKSSILQSLLLLRQTIDTPTYGERLILRGPLYFAGNYHDLIHKHRSSSHLKFTYWLSPDREEPESRLELEFLSDEPQPPRLARLRVESKGLDFLEIRRGRGRGGPFELQIGDLSMGGESDANFRFAVNRFFPLIGDEPRRQGRPSQRRERSRSLARSVLEAFERSLLGIRAVGAFREEPARRYEHQGRASEIVDLHGRSTIQALIDDSTRRGRLRGSLIEGVNEWLLSVGRVRLMPFKRISATARLFEVRLRDTDSGRWANFADVGFGIGQALPVIVEGLRTAPGGTFIVQEPEIHLHPDAQLAMADFLVWLGESGRKVIVETHSEALLLRFRHAVLRASKRASFPAPEDVCVLYVDKRRTGQSNVTRLSVDALGQVSSWPRGFMEETTSERMALLRGMTRTSKRAR